MARSAAVSAGILLFRRRLGRLEVLLVHPGGPFWARRDQGAWTIPKGALTPGEAPIDAARREFAEETGWPIAGEAIALGQVRQAAGKLVHAWAVEGDADPATLQSNTFELEWPRGSGRIRRYPEADRAAWFDPVEARLRILPAQAALIDALEAHLSRTPDA